MVKQHYPQTKEGVERRMTKRKGWGPEDLLSKDVNDFMIAMKSSGAFVGVCFHIPNEHQPPQMNVWQAKNYWRKREAMGVRDGATDWVFCCADGCGLIELKPPETFKVSEKTGKIIQDRPAGKLSEKQELFRDDCISTGVNHAVCYSVMEVEDTLREWGMLRF